VKQVTPAEAERKPSQVVTPQARRRVRWCEWCGASMEQIREDGRWVPDYYRCAEFYRAITKMSAEVRKPRFGKRFCSASCRQRSYEARKTLRWKVDGEWVSGEELVRRGWVLSSWPAENGKPNAPRRVVATLPKRGGAA